MIDSRMEEQIRRVDRGGMREMLRRFPDQFARGVEIGTPIRVRGGYDQVIVAGVGGSAFPADKFDLHLGPLPVRLEICRDYQIRVPLDERSLVFACSFSGNTEETLSAFEQAVAARADVVAITTGGRLGEMARDAGVPLARIPEDPAKFQPRFASGYFFAIYACVLGNAGLVHVRTDDFHSLAAFLRERMPELESTGGDLAKQLIGRIPLIYTSERYARSVARITKIKFNENAKTPAFWNAFPELNHNEMQGFEFEVYPFHFILLRDPLEDPRILKRMSILVEQLQEKSYPMTLYDLQGENQLAKAFDGLVLGDWASYYLAVIRGINPMPVQFIERFKEKMKGG